MTLFQKYSDFLISHKFFFFLGKGGSGKTTLSILFSKFFGKNTLLFSLDPAHNISDYLGLKEKKEFKEFKNIFIYEPDIEKLIDKKAFEESRKIEKISPLFILFEDSLRENFRFLPGIEEDCMIDLIIKGFYDNYDRVIFDMPPTALSLRIVSLILMRKKLLSFLLNQRKKIIELRKILGEKIEKDPVYEKIKENLNIYEKFYPEFKKSIFFVVYNPFEASIKEGDRINDFLKKNGLIVKKIMNRVKEGSFKGFDIIIPEIENPLKLFE